MAPYFNNSADMRIRVISALCYLSLGVVGLIYIILQAKNNESQFFRYHFMQGILIGIFIMLVGWLGSTLGMTFGGILGLFGGATAGIQGTLMLILGLIVQLVTVVGYIAIVYGMVQSLRGKFADMPVVTKIVRNNLR